MESWVCNISPLGSKSKKSSDGIKIFPEFPCFELVRLLAVHDRTVQPKGVRKTVPAERHHSSLLLVETGSLDPNH